jgi:ABC-2 type transport system ATP-binding protein
MITSEHALQTKGLSKEYAKVKRLTDLALHPFRQETTVALNDINVEIKKSELVCLMGANGSGKTTFLKILGGMLLPTGGEIYINGDKINRLQKLREKVHLETGNERSFYWRLTAKENLSFFGSLYGIGLKQLEERLGALFTLFEIEDPNRRFYEYSSGFKKRFCIIRALINNPEVLLLDEPANNLDFFGREKLFGYIKDKFLERAGRAVIISTNNFDNPDWLGLYDKIILLHKGIIKAQGNAQELKNHLGISNLDNKELSKALCGLKS